MLQQLLLWQRLTGYRLELGRCRNFRSVFGIFSVFFSKSVPVAVPVFSNIALSISVSVFFSRPLLSDMYSKIVISGSILRSFPIMPGFPNGQQACSARIDFFRKYSHANLSFLDGAICVINHYTSRISTNDRGNKAAEVGNTDRWVFFVFFWSVYDIYGICYTDFGIGILKYRGIGLVSVLPTHTTDRLLTVLTTWLAGCPSWMTGER